MNASLTFIKNGLTKLRMAMMPSAEASHERYRRVFLTGLSTAMTRGISIATSVITVPLTLRYLGAERYGMWMAITSIVMMLSFADMGLGLGLINFVADNVGRGEPREARRAVASGFWMLVGIATVLLVAATILYPFIAWNHLFNVQSALAVSESGAAFMVLFLCFAVGLPLGIANNVRTGLQEGFVNNLWAILGSLCTLFALLLAIHFHAGLPMLILGLSGGPLLAVMGNAIRLFVWEQPQLSPGIGYVSSTVARRLLGSGLMFFLIQVSLAVAYQSDNIVIAQVMGAKAVAAYAVPARLFNMVASLLNLISGAMWPAYADAKARSDWQWIRKSFMRTTLLSTTLSAALTLLLIIFGNRILALWVGSQLKASGALLALLGLRCVLNAYLQPINFLLNGLNELKTQAILMVVMSVVNISLSILFVRHFGIIGAVLGTVAAETLVLVIPMTFVLHRLLTRLGSR